MTRSKLSCMVGEFNKSVLPIRERNQKIWLCHIIFTAHLRYPGSWVRWTIFLTPSTRRGWGARPGCSRCRWRRRGTPRGSPAPRASPRFGCTASGPPTKCSGSLGKIPGSYHHSSWLSGSYLRGKTIERSGFQKVGFKTIMSECYLQLQGVGTLQPGLRFPPEQMGGNSGSSSWPWSERDWAISGNNELMIIKLLLPWLKHLKLRRKLR